MNSDRPIAAPVFIGGAGRSGTTLLRVILDSHPSITCGPELKVVPLIAEMWAKFQEPLYPTLEAYRLSRQRLNEIFATMIGSLLEELRAASGKPRIAEKTPDNVFFFQHLAHLFPESPLVHVIRDGRDVVSSLLRSNWIDPVTQQRDRRTTDVAEAARYWVSAIRMGRLAATKTRHYVEVRYEDLVGNSEPTLVNLLRSIGEPFDARVLSHHAQAHDLGRESSTEQVRAPIHTRPVGAWKERLTSDQCRIVTEIAGPTLAELGYDETPVV